MRVAINAIPLVGPLTGIGNYTWHLAREMAVRLPEPPWLFYGREWSRELRTPAVSSGAAARRKAGAVLPFAHHAARWWQQRHFRPGAASRGIELYHEPNYLAYRFDGALVVTVHDLSWVRHPETHPADRVRTMEQVMPGVVRRAQRIAVDSDFVRGEVIAHYGVPPGRVVTTHLGVSAEFAPRDAASCAPFLATMDLRFGEYFLAVGTLEPRKNLAAAVRAFARLPQPVRARFPLVVAGMSGWGRDRLPADFTRLLDAGEARLAGFVAQAQLPCLYSGARLFIYPSIYEGFGLPPLEAMACGVPVVASRAASLPEVVGDAGVLVDPRDDGAIAIAMARAIEDGAWREGLAARGLAQAAGFTWGRCADRTLALYREAMLA
jgi:glycosyltransferase involved in cell wall biosynthesis